MQKFVALSFLEDRGLKLTKICLRKAEAILKINCRDFLKILQGNVGIIL
jgi:hypothetical protein